MPEKSLEELEAMVGTSRTTVVDLEIERGKVDEFARAIRDDNPAYREEGAATSQGFDRIPAPLTFTQVARHPRYQPDGMNEEGIQGFDLGFDPQRTVHGEQEYAFERPLLVGETLTGRTTLTGVSRRERDAGALTFAELTTEYRTQDDELVLTEIRTAIET